MKYINVKVVNKSKFPLPKYETIGSSGMDVRANIESSITLKAGERIVIPTGLFFDLPEGYEIQVRSRSGMAAKYGVFVLNSPGTIDQDYSGELKIILCNSTKNEDLVIEPGDRIAQIVISEVQKMVLDEVEEITKITERGDGGFGHTGKK